MLETLQLLAFLLISQIGFLHLKRFFETPTSEPKGEENPTISIVIPARNEQERLGRLLATLAAQTIRPHEVIVVDDGSSDGTAELAKRFDCRVLATANKEWSGKSAACYAGAMAASGDYLLFLDADVYLAPDALAYIINCAGEAKVLSIQPYHCMERAYEQFSLFFNLASFLGLGLGGRQRWHTKYGLFGPCVLIERKTYLRTGGHALVKDSLLEDMALGQKLAAEQIPLFSLPHGKKIFFRMYGEGFRKLFDGWTKNMALGAQKSSLADVMIVFSLITTALALPLQLTQAVMTASLYRTLFLVVLYLLFSLELKTGAGRLGNFSWICALLFPIPAAFFVLVMLRSFAMKFLRIPINWRGRNVTIK